MSRTSVGLGPKRGGSLIGGGALNGEFTVFYNREIPQIVFAVVSWFFLVALVCKNWVPVLTSNIRKKCIIQDLAIFNNSDIYGNLSE